MIGSFLLAIIALLLTSALQRPSVVAAQEVDLEVVESSRLDAGPDVVDKAHHESFVVDGA